MSPVAAGDSRGGMRPRFSLLGILFLMAIVALALVVAQLWREVGPLRSQVRRLHAETGQLTIDDPKQIYVMAIAQPDELTKHWKWRVYLPDSHKYLLHLVTSPVPEAGFPASGVSSGQSRTLSSGEQVIEAALKKDESGHWQLHSFVQNVGADGLSNPGGGSVSLTHEEWVDGPAGLGWTGVNNSPQSFDADKQLELLRLRPQEFLPMYPGTDDPNKKGIGSTRAARGPVDGILIWIDEQL